MRFLPGGRSSAISRFYPRPTGDPGRDRKARSVHIACVATLTLTFVLFALLLSFGKGRPSELLTLMGGATCLFVALQANLKGDGELAARIASFAILFMLTLLASQARDGVRSVTMIAFPGLLVLAVLLLNGFYYAVLSTLTILIVTVLGIAEVNGLIGAVSPVRSPTTYLTITFIDLILLCIALIGGLITRDSRKNVADLRGTVEQLASANNQLSQSEARYRSLIELAVDAIFITNTAGAILEVNQQACRLAASSRETLLGSPITTVLASSQKDLSRFQLDQPRRDRPLTTVHHISQTGAPVITVELNSMMMPDGVIQWFCRDITERLATEQALAQLQKMESIGRLAGGVAHDFNNLLTIINGYSEMLLSDMLPNDPSRGQCKAILDAGNRAKSLTGQLLAFSRRQVLQPRLIDLHHVIDEMQSMLTRLVGEDISVTVALNARHSTVNADPHQFQQVVMNLTVNARDAMPNGGALSIETSDFEASTAVPPPEIRTRTGAWIVLSVSDTGFGMDEKTQQHIFEPFFTTKEIGKGSGLGLSMVQGVVAQSGGWMEVQSSPGCGAAFRIFLPSVAEDATRAPAVPAASTERAGLRGNESVLVVEDQPGVLAYVSAVLSSYGYRVLRACNSAEALHIFEQAHDTVDLVLTDVVMPNGSGRELADKLEHRQPGVRVLFMSGYTDDIMLKHRVVRHDGHFIQKPFNSQDLAARVRTLLDA